LHFFGSLVIEGSGKGLVIQVGDQSLMGTITSLTSQNQNPETGLHIEINRFVTIIVILAVVTGIIAFVAWVAWLRVAYPTYLSISNMLSNLIGLVVAYVPEGLPICVTITLTLMAQRMHKEHILVKNMPIMETFNSITVIASDKTGTLTTNKMSVVHVTLVPSKTLSNSLSYYHAGSTNINANNSSGANDNNNYELEQKCSKQKEEIVRAGALCNAAYLDEQSRMLMGDATDKAVYEFVKNHNDFGFSIEEYRRRNPSLAVIPFNSRNKFMVTIQKIENMRNHVLFLKGAPEMVLARCSTMLDNDSKEIELTNELRSLWQEHQGLLSEQGERVIGVARVLLNSAIYTDAYNYIADSDESLINFPIKDLCFIGMIGIIDPPKPGVPQSIATCRRAHIRVIMVTGDHPKTAEAIAKQIGLISPDSKIDYLYIRKNGKEKIVCNKSENIELNYHTRITPESQKEDEEKKRKRQTRK